MLLKEIIVHSFSIFKLVSFHFCMISSPNLEKPPVLISLLDPIDYWFDFGKFEALEAGAEGCLAPSDALTSLFMLL